MTYFDAESDCRNKISKMYCHGNIYDKLAGTTFAVLHIENIKISG